MFSPCVQAFGGVAPKTFQKVFRFPGRHDFRKNGDGSEPRGRSRRSVRAVQARFPPVFSPFRGAPRIKNRGAAGMGNCRPVEPIATVGLARRRTAAPTRCRLTRGDGREVRRAWRSFIDAARQDS